MESIKKQSFDTWRLSKTLLLLSLCVLQTNNVLAQTQVAPVGFPLPNWATEPWYHSDDPYRSIEQEVDSAIAKQALTSKDLLDFQTIATTQNQSAPAQFRWTYAAYRAGQEKIHVDGIYPLTSALGRSPNPHCYEYSRIGFLIQTQFGPDPHYVKLGDRLLAYKPHDYIVEYKLVGCVDPNLSQKIKLKI